jgi:hypothetical protein
MWHTTDTGLNERRALQCAKHFARLLCGIRQ